MWVIVDWQVHGRHQDTADDVCVTVIFENMHRIPGQLRLKIRSIGTSWRCSISSHRAGAAVLRDLRPKLDITRNNSCYRARPDGF